MTTLTREDYENGGKRERSFTCAACGGFKYLQVPCFADYKDVAICTDCWENRGPTVWVTGRSKPGQHEVLASIRDYYAGNQRDLKGWMRATFGTEDEDAAAEALQKIYMSVWKDHYRKVTGEEWA